MGAAPPRSALRRGVWGGEGHAARSRAAAILVPSPRDCVGGRKAIGMVRGPAVGLRCTCHPSVGLWDGEWLSCEWQWECAPLRACEPARVPEPVCAQLLRSSPLRWCRRRFGRVAVCVGRLWRVSHAGEPYWSPPPGPRAALARGCGWRQPTWPWSDAAHIQLYLGASTHASVFLSYWIISRQSIKIMLYLASRPVAIGAVQELGDTASGYSARQWPWTRCAHTRANLNARWRGAGR